MKLVEIKERAAEIGAENSGRKKTPIIHSIQEAEGNKACYGTNNGSCPYDDCCWRSDCIREYGRNH